MTDAMIDDVLKPYDDFDREFKIAKPTTKSETHTFNVSQDKKTITITCTSTPAPNIYTPLYVMMPGEVNFGYVIIVWVLIHIVYLLFIVLLVIMIYVKNVS